MINIGKRFENNFRDSVSDDILYYRLKDSAQSFGNSNHLRFSSKNPFDCLLYKSPSLFALELKSVGTSSISFERSKDEKGIIHYHQIQGLNEWGKHEGVIAGLILNFRHKDGNENCYFVHIQDFVNMVQTLDKKSFNEKDLCNYNPLIIKSEKKKVNYRYDISKFIIEAQEKYMKQI